MLFGLWIEPESVGLESETCRRHPEWIVTRKGRPLAHVAERLNLDFTNPDVRAWVEGELVRVITDYGVDIIRFDGAPMSAFIGERVDRGYLENIIWRHYEFLYGVMERLAARFPRLLIENCCGGGGRLDLGILSRSHRTQITDEARPPRSVQILNGVSLMLPPEYTMIFPHLPGWLAETSDPDFIFRVALFGGMYTLGWTRRVPDRHPGFEKTSRRYVDLYKAVVAPLLPGCRVFHHTPIGVLEGAEATPSCVLEYAAADGRAAMVGVFKLTDGPEPVVVYPRGLDPAATYRVRFDNDGADGAASGLSLRREGVRVPLPRPLSSELLLFTRE
jgi:alpha-galactosidase